MKIKNLFMVNFLKSAPKCSGNEIVYYIVNVIGLEPGRKLFFFKQLPVTPDPGASLISNFLSESYRDIRDSRFFHRYQVRPVR
jgi:hypothetical protein